MRQNNKLRWGLMGSDIKYTVNMKPVNLDQKLVKNRQCQTKRLFSSPVAKVHKRLVALSEVNKGKFFRKIQN